MEHKLPDRFEQFDDARRAGFLRAKDVKERGGMIAGTFCAFTPVEVPEAGGMKTVSLCGTNDETVPDAEAHLPKNLCPLIKSSYGFALTDKCPYTYFSDLIIGETTCDGKKKMYELLGELKDVFVMQMPQTVSTEAALELWTSELHRLKDRVEEKTGHKITDDDLREASRVRNRFRKAKVALMELQRMTPPPAWGFGIYKVMEATNFNFDPIAAIEVMEKLHDEITRDFDAGARPVPESAKRILVTGCPIGGVFAKTISAIEEHGGVVVCYENCGGIKPMRRMVDTEAPDIVRAIADRSLNIGCPVMTPNSLRMQLIRELVSEYEPDGIVEIDLQACTPYTVERRKIKLLADELGVPYTSIETDFSKSDAGQIATRLEAFIEML